MSQTTVVHARIDAATKNATGKPLPREYQDHPLLGRWVGRRDCHLEPDWISIYRLRVDELRLERTGTHSDLFG